MTTRANFYVDQGVDFQATLDLFDAAGFDFDITMQTFRCEVRKLYSSALAFEATIVVNEDDLDLNNIDLIVPASITRGVEPGKYQYDVIMFDGNKTNKILEGLLFLLPSITNTEEE